MILDNFSEYKSQHTQQLSVIIPTYNDGDYLKDAILSVSKSSHPLLEIIVVDDGSKSEDARIIVELLSCEIDIPIIYKRKDNGGPSSARNTGLNIARGEWISFLDSDDIMLPNSIKSKLEHFDNCKNTRNVVGIYGSFIWSTSGLTQSFNQSCKPISRNYVGVMGKAPGGAPAYIFKRKALIHTGGFDESLIYNEDFDLLLRLIKSGYELLGTNEPGFIRNIREASLTRSTALKTLIGGRIFLKKAFQEDLLDKSEIIRRFVINYLITLKLFFIHVINRCFHRHS